MTTDGLTTLSVRVAAAAPVFPVVAGLGAVLGWASVGFAGSMIVSALVAEVFAGHNLREHRTTGDPRLAASVLTALFGAWFIYAPLAYAPNALATALVQTGGMTMAAFGAYAGLDVIERLAADTPMG